MQGPFNRGEAPAPYRLTERLTSPMSMAPFTSESSAQHCILWMSPLIPTDMNRSRRLLWRKGIIQWKTMGGFQDGLFTLHSVLSAAIFNEPFLDRIPRISFLKRLCLDKVVVQQAGRRRNRIRIDRSVQCLGLNAMVVVGYAARTSHQLAIVFCMNLSRKRCIRGGWIDI